MSVAARPGFFGAYGGRYVPETVIPALEELERGWRGALQDPAFRAASVSGVGRPA